MGNLSAFKSNSIEPSEDRDAVSNEDWLKGWDEVKPRFFREDGVPITMDTAFVV